MILTVCNGFTVIHKIKGKENELAFNSSEVLSFSNPNLLKTGRPKAMFGLGIKERKGREGKEIALGYPSLVCGIVNWRRR